MDATESSILLNFVIERMLNKVSFSDIEVNTHFARILGIYFVNQTVFKIAQDRSVSLHENVLNVVTRFFKESKVFFEILSI